ncbi:cobalamin biosynthesis protein CobG [Streptomyces sp. NPDC047097]|uniref:cobalamin biosynthesis protein CobG n=1 Tax=Streptomyces sp. NPDC047097 TaxID=3155260 RepID=UPI00340017D0
MLAAMPSSSPKRPEPGEGHIRTRRSGRVRDRGDACPGALRLHRADDGALARLRLPTGVLTEHQTRVLADAADRLGDGHLSLTSRGNLELRGLGESCGLELAELLRGAGLLPGSEAHERIRNMVVSPLAGPRVQAAAHALDALLCGEAWTTGLSGRFLFAVDDGRGDVAALGADVTLRAAADGDFTTGGDSEAGGDFEAHGDSTADRDLPADRDFRADGGCEAGGGYGARGAFLLIVADRAYEVAGADAPAAALAAARAFLTAAEAAGTGAWRIGELPDGGRGMEVAEELARAGVTASPIARPVTPSAGSGPPPPGILDGGFLSVSARLGRVTSDQFRALLPAAEIRVTPWRGFVLPAWPDEAAARDRLAELAAAGYLTAPDTPWATVSACTGRPGCAKSLADVRGDARPLGGGLPVHWSGCERRCGHPRGDWVDMVATGEGSYQQTVHTRAGAPGAMFHVKHGVAQDVSRETVPGPRPPLHDQ